MHSEPGQDAEQENGGEYAESGTKTPPVKVGVHGVENVVAANHRGVHRPDGRPELPRFAGVVPDGGIPITSRATEGSEARLVGVVNDRLLCFRLFIIKLPRTDRIGLAGCPAATLLSRRGDVVGCRIRRACVHGAGVALAVVMLVACELPPELPLGDTTDQPLTWVWYPSESEAEYAESRAALMGIAADATGRVVTERLTSDSADALDALVNNEAAFGWVGGEGYARAHADNPEITPLVTNSPGDSLSAAKYYSLIAVLNLNEAEYRVGSVYEVETVEQERISFVSSTSTSGFLVPAALLANAFGVDTSDLLVAGPTEVFSEVLLPGSHQGSLENLLDGSSDVAAFCNVCVDEVFDWDAETLTDPVAGDLITVVAGSGSRFDPYVGIAVRIIAVVPVVNSPIVASGTFLSSAEMDAVVAALTSASTADNADIFGTGTFFPSGHRFLAVDDAFYAPVRTYVEQLQ